LGNSPKESRRKRREIKVIVSASSSGAAGEMQGHSEWMVGKNARESGTKAGKFMKR